MNAEGESTYAASQEITADVSASAQKKSIFPVYLIKKIIDLATDNDYDPSLLSREYHDRYLKNFFTLDLLHKNLSNENFQFIKQHFRDVTSYKVSLPQLCKLIVYNDSLNIKDLHLKYSYTNHEQKIIAEIFHPETREIILKNPQTSTNYIKLLQSIDQKNLFANLEKLSLQDERPKNENNSTATFSKPYIDSILPAILNQNIFPNLTRIDLYGMNLGDQGATIIANSPSLSNLKSLKLTYTNIGVEGASKIANSSYFSNVTKLKLTGNPIHNEGIIAFANSKYSSNLIRLDVGECKIGHTGASKIGESPFFSNIITLKVAGNNIGGKGAANIINSPYLSKLRKLDLEKNGIGEDGALEIADSKGIAKLTSLNLCENAIKNVGAIKIVNSEYLFESVLDPNSKETTKIAESTQPCKFRKLDKVAIVNRNHLLKLRELNLDSNQITNKGVKAIVNSQNIAKLTMLSLSDNKIENEGAITIANTQHLLELRTLKLAVNNIKADGAKKLAAFFLERTQHPTSQYGLSIDLSYNLIPQDICLEIINELPPHSRFDLGAQESDEENDEENDN